MPLNFVGFNGEHIIRVASRANKVYHW